MTAADQPTTGPSVQAVAEALHRHESGSSRWDGCLPCTKRAQVLADAGLLAPAPQPAADTESEVRGGPLCSTCDGVGLVGSNHMNSGPCPACTERDARLRGIQERIDAATEGPWYWRNTTEPYLMGPQTRVVMAFARMGMQGAQPQFRGDDNILEDAGRANLNAFPDARLIAAAPEDLSWLLAEVARLDAVVTAVRELHVPRWVPNYDGDSDLVCSCGYIANDEDDTCPTIGALDGGAS